jgi:acyl-CoA dehydrogenase
MSIYRAPIDDVLFLFQEVLPDLQPSLSDSDLIAVLAEAARFAEERLRPLNQIGDRDGCVRHADGTVTMPEGFRQAWRDYALGGWIGLSIDEAAGGQGLPAAVDTVVGEFLSSANMAFTMTVGLTRSAIAALVAHADPALVARYVPAMIAGRWAGTMNLTEPQCGTDLGLIKTRAVPRADGSYALNGTKIFITAGEHDLTENIIHLVLARIEGAPPGTAGLSLFVVPKRSFAPDGSLGGSNGVICGGLETKMGIHASPTCTLHYDNAIGDLVGEAGKGLRAMFTMMNEARLGVALQGLALSEVARQNAAHYARDRLQGRALGGPALPNAPADPIIVHPDIRRMLMEIRAFDEPARALLLWTAMQGDKARAAGDPDKRAMAADLMAFMTPVLKGMLTDRGFANTVLAQQVFGGHGYITANGMDQFVRDARIAMIYEGTNGIQALDLVGRKIPMNDGRTLKAVIADLVSVAAACAADPDLKPLSDSLGMGLGRLEAALKWLGDNGRHDIAATAAGANDMMHLIGLVAIGGMSARIAIAARRRQREGRSEPDAIAKDGSTDEARLVRARFFMERILPEAAMRLARITAGSDSVMTLAPEFL